MSLGKGHRSSSLTRNTSMKVFDLDMGIIKNPEENKIESDSELLLMSGAAEQNQHQQIENHQEQSVWGGNDGMDMRFLSSVVSPRKPRRSSCDFSHVLRTCGLCNRRIGSKKDIYMYRGEVAFCSMECRQQQMEIDEKTEKSLSVAMRNDRDDPKQKIAGNDGSSGGVD